MARLGGVEGRGRGVRRMLLLMLMVVEHREGGGGRAAGATAVGRHVGGKEVLEDGIVGRGRAHHLREVGVGELGHDEVPAPEQVFAQWSARAHLLLHLADGAVHGEGRVIARDNGVVDDVWVDELLVHHVE